MSAIYVIGSLSNPRVCDVAKILRTEGWRVFDDWMAAGEFADRAWQAYEIARGHSYQEALQGHAANHVFGYDKSHLDRCDIGVLVLPAGKSGHLELGYLAGRNKHTFILLDGEPAKYDVMYLLATGVCISIEELVRALEYLK